MFLVRGKVSRAVEASDEITRQGSILAKQNRMMSPAAVNNGTGARAPRFASRMDPPERDASAAGTFIVPMGRRGGSSGSAGQSVGGNP